MTPEGAQGSLILTIEYPSSIYFLEAVHHPHLLVRDSKMRDVGLLASENPPITTEDKGL